MAYNNILLLRSLVLISQIPTGHSNCLSVIFVLNISFFMTIMRYYFSWNQHPYCTTLAKPKTRGLRVIIMRQAGYDGQVVVKLDTGQLPANHNPLLQLMVLNLKDLYP